MTLYRAVVGFAAVITALLLQATVIGPVFLPIPVSLVLVLVLGTAVVAGPGAGIALGFGAGLLADLTSTHPVGLLALAWLGGGLAAGRFGGLTAGPSRVAGGRRRLGQVLATGRDQCLVIGVVAAVTTVVATGASAVLVRPHDPLAPAVGRALVAGVIDAGLALLVLPLITRTLRAAALHTVRVQPRAAGVPRLPLTAWEPERDAATTAS